jgi:hypothetical protein
MGGLHQILIRKMQGLVKCFAVGWGGVAGGRTVYFGDPGYLSMEPRRLRFSGVKSRRVQRNRRGSGGWPPAIKSGATPSDPLHFRADFSCGFITWNLVQDWVWGGRGVGHGQHHWISKNSGWGRNKMRFFYLNLVCPATGSRLHAINLTQIYYNATKIQ